MSVKVDPILESFILWGSKQEVTKVVPLGNNGRNLEMYPYTFSTHRMPGLYALFVIVMEIWHHPYFQVYTPEQAFRYSNQRHNIFFSNNLIHCYMPKTNFLMVWLILKLIFFLLLLLTNHIVWSISEGTVFTGIFCKKGNETG